jgi:hypothetical protein
MEVGRVRVGTGGGAQRRRAGEVAAEGQSDAGGGRAEGLQHTVAALDYDTSRDAIVLMLRCVLPDADVGCRTPL